MAQFETWLQSDLQRPLTVQTLTGVVFSADSQANVLGVEVLDGGAPAALSGTVMGYIIRADGATVSVAGALAGSRASIVLPQSAYAVTGPLDIVIKLTQGSGSSPTVTTLGACRAYVQRSTTDTIVDPGHIIPSLEELLALIEPMEQGTAAANAAAQAANAAAGNASAKAAAADAAAQNAASAAQTANTAAQNADEAAAGIQQYDGRITALENYASWKTTTDWATAAAGAKTDILVVFTLLNTVVISGNTYFAYMKVHIPVALLDAGRKFYAGDSFRFGANLCYCGASARTGALVNSYVIRNDAELAQGTDYTVSLLYR